MRKSISIIGLLWTIGCAGSGGQEESARSLLEAQLGRPDVTLRAGDVEFTVEAPGTDKKVMVFRLWPLYERANELGLITLTNIRDLSKSNGDWSDWFAMSQRGIRLTTHVALEKDAIRKATNLRPEIRSEDGVEYLDLHVAKMTVQEIVQDEQQKLGTERYRVIQASYLYDVPDDWSQAFEKFEQWDHVRETRLRDLFKYDMFNKKWAFFTADVGKRSMDFPTNEVPRWLTSLGWKTAP
jgi:hypothetical protein